MSNSKSVQSVSAIVEVPVTSTIDLTNPTMIKLIEQGGTVVTVFLGCVFLYLLIELIKVAKDD
ncbi:MAG: hypothetical protein J0L70_30000 [Leptolyngbya sp. UWPOB_LEPTO1]|uniref:hypothetical protein n=1 Tax=Leptolyngbya sp. UWPOB_LEPTO1 TaxID=2815653 RepID=UPI001ACD9CD4|nr:hypothetical protein [Leptolyngbya sp. UWPOB_LEPTO1]MBN8564770.1 hypothetical protein [Leptolyngbya sp. UWPOB_LEPTO1]